MLSGLINILSRIASVADSLRRKIFVFLAVALLFLGLLCVDLYSAEAVWWWNLFIIGFVFLPWLVWGFIWMILGQLRQTPELAKELLQDKDELLASFDNKDIAEPKGFRGVLTTINQIRKHEGLEDLFDTIAGIGLICNPIFLLLAFLFLLMITVLMFITPIVLLF